MLAAGSAAWCRRAAGGGGRGLRAWLFLGAEADRAPSLWRPPVPAAPRVPQTWFGEGVPAAGTALLASCWAARGAAPTKAVSGGRCSRHLLLFSVPAAVTEGL